MRFSKDFAVGASRGSVIILKGESSVPDRTRECRVLDGEKFSWSTAIGSSIEGMKGEESRFFSFGDSNSIVIACTSYLSNRFTVAGVDEFSAASCVGDRGEVIVLFDGTQSQLNVFRYGRLTEGGLVLF